MVIALIGTAATGVVGWFVTFGLDRAVKNSGTPIRVRLIADPAVIDVFANETIALVLPKRPTADPPAAGCQGFHDWAQRAGGIDRQRTLFRVVVQGASDRAVVIDRVSARIISRDGAAPTVGVECPTAGNVISKTLDLDLDSPVANALLRSNADQAVSGVTLVRGETEFLDIIAHTAKSHVTTWTLVLELTVDGTSHRIEVFNHDRPFQTTAGRPITTISWGNGWAGNLQRGGG